MRTLVIVAGVLGALALCGLVAAVLAGKPTAALESFLAGLAVVTAVLALLDEIAG